VSVVDLESRFILSSTFQWKIYGHTFFVFFVLSLAYSVILDDEDDSGRRYHGAIGNVGSRKERKVGFD
jgi:hypothetical protein